MPWQAVVTLRAQYRMAADIMALANVMIYNGQLRCATQAVATASLPQLSVPPNTQLPGWMHQVSALLWKLHGAVSSCMLHWA